MAKGAFLCVRGIYIGAERSGGKVDSEMRSKILVSNSSWFIYTTTQKKRSCIHFVDLVMFMKLPSRSFLCLFSDSS